MLPLANYLNGQLVPPISGRYLDNTEPATGQVYGRLPASGPEDVAVAVAAAEAVLPAWRARPAEERGQLLLKIADLIDANLARLAQAESRDTGKPVSLARVMDIPRAASNFRFFGTAAEHFASEAHMQPGLALNYTVRHPLGVVGCISPWNLPLYLFTWKIAPALAVGCCVVAKPSEIAPVTACLLGELCIEAGLPPGVLNIVHGTGPGCGQALVEHPGIRAISFTGGTATGQHLAATAAPLFKKLTQVAVGKTPNLVFADCDLADAVPASVRSAFANQGQICLCGSRIFIERPIYEQFKAEVLSRVAELSIGDPLDETTRQGALVSEAHLSKVLAYIQLVHDEGGRLLAGGRRVQLEGRCVGGYFLAPTVFESLPPTAAPTRRKSSGRWSRSRPSTRRRKPCAWPTPPTMASRPPSGPGVWPAPTAWRRPCTRAWSGLIPGCTATCARPSAA